MEEVDRTAVTERKNLVHWFAGRVHEVLDDVTGLEAGEEGSGLTPVVCVASLSHAETSESLVELGRRSIGSEVSRRRC
jgi:hypothetical protein